jgi:hypothetical protein
MIHKVSVNDNTKIGSNKFAAVMSRWISFQHRRMTELHQLGELSVWQPASDALKHPAKERRRKTLCTKKTSPSRDKRKEE